MLDAIATAHTRDDQAETVLAKILRGAWTEGLSGIHPTVESPEGRILRPLLRTTRAEVESYLNALGQGWREDSSNRQLTYTRNRIRHELLPLLEGWNPRLREHLTQMAQLARDEEAWWTAEVARWAAQILLHGRPARGGGRAAGDGVALEVTRLAALAPALQRRLLRFAAEKLGAAIDFPATEALRALALGGRAGQRLELEKGLRAERTPRELRLAILPVGTMASDASAEYTVTIPGEVTGFGLRLRIEATEPSSFKSAEMNCEKDGSHQAISSGAKSLFDPNDISRGLKPPSPSVSLLAEASIGQTATLRNWRPGDRVRLRFTSAPRKVKEVLERLKITGSSRAVWPVLELEDKIIWMQGVELEPTAGILIQSKNLEEDGSRPS